MRILVIGGTGFVGAPVVQQLYQQGHTLLVVHRGRTQAALPSEVQYLLTDRAHLQEHRQDFQRFAPEVVLDMIPYTEDDARCLMETFHGIAQRVVVISSGDVSLNEALRQTIAWQRANPPGDSDADLFDYTLEDAVLAEAQEKPQANF